MLLLKWLDNCSPLRTSKNEASNRLTSPYPQCVTELGLKIQNIYSSFYNPICSIL